MALSRKDKIIKYSNAIASRLDLTLVDKELNYGRGIGRADNYCIINNRSIIFEIEFSQRHPEMNVLKSWMYLEKNKQEKIFVIQHITNTEAVSPNRVGLCSWLGEKIKKEMNDRFDYYLIKNAIKQQDIVEIKNILRKN